MRFTVVTLFPEMFESVLGASMLGRARERGLVQVDFVNPRDFTHDRHRTADDSPYGGGPGMVMKVEPLVAAIEAAGAGHRVLLSPGGAPLVQARVRALAGLDHIVLVCGRYEGIDERVTEECIDEELSLGDFVLTGGELGALTIIDAVSRYVPGVLGEATSTDEESFSDGLLEYPQYTRPQEFRGRAVPEILLSGDHGKIRAWRRRQSLLRTARRRPELFARAALESSFADVLDDEPTAALARRTWIILAHYPVFDRTGAVVTSAVTTLDIHDIARSAATYGIGGYQLVNPVTVQREKVDRVVAAWAEGVSRGAGADFRQRALSLVHTAPLIEDALGAIAEAHGGVSPLVVSTSARSDATQVGFRALWREAVELPERPLALVFGTGWGLTKDALALASHRLAPLCGRPDFNHLSVRSAAAVVLDRLFGLRSDE